MLGSLFLLLAIVVMVGALVMRKRVHRTVQGERPITGDDPVLEEILSGGEGWREDDEPLDEEHIRDEEDRFWEQEWEDPEDWRG
jgi:hypothetical protein